MTTRSSRDNDPLGLLGREMTTEGRAMGKIEARSALPDHELLADECPGEFPDTVLARTVGRLLGFDEARLDQAISSGLKAGYFRPRD